MNEEQIEELGALESIYPDIIQKQTENCFDVIISASLTDDSNDGVKLNVLFTENYPKEPPITSYKSLGSFPNSCLDDIKTIVTEVIARSLDSPMIFDIIESIREYLEKFYTVEPVAPVKIFKKTYETYTPVSLESFLAWKKSYDDEEKDLIRIREETIKNDIYINGLTYTEVWAKPTGRQLFEGGFEIEEEVKEEDIELIG